MLNGLMGFETNAELRREILLEIIQKNNSSKDLLFEFSQ